MFENHQPDPVLIHQCETRHSFLVFPKFNTAMFIFPSETKALPELFCLLPSGEPNWWNWSGDKDDWPTVAIRIPEWQVHKVSHCGSKQQQKSPDEITLQYYCLFMPYIYICVLFIVHITFMVNRTFNTTSTYRLQHHPFLFAANSTDRTFVL